MGQSKRSRKEDGCNTLPFNLPLCWWDTRTNLESLLIRSYVKDVTHRLRGTGITSGLSPYPLHPRIPPRIQCAACKWCA